jgi:hypothetical protein
MGDWLERVVPARWHVENGGDAGGPETCPRQPDDLWLSGRMAMSGRHDGGANRRLSI